MTSRTPAATRSASRFACSIDAAMLHVASTASNTSTGAIAVVGVEAGECAVAPDAPTNPITTTASNSEAPARTIPPVCTHHPERDTDDKGARTEFYAL